MVVLRYLLLIDIMIIYLIFCILLLSGLKTKSKKKKIDNDSKK
ncbi:hypothetical protein CAAU_1738 [Caloramator australicus RC3]|uniref:Uncharacterized protein n=1 Tax=Caloramator australicus RC3 TaxID=857293 RepID=I7J5K1_9CLOT|nr:hypothetical protein CAAU_1738 [Caloramator australicus RC3]